MEKIALFEEQLTASSKNIVLRFFSPHFIRHGVENHVVY